MNSIRSRIETTGEWLLEALADGVVLIDPEWRVVYVNAAAERQLRVDKGTLLGKAIGGEIPEPPAERMDVYRSVMRTGDSRVIHDVHATIPGLADRVFDAEVHASPGGGIAIVFRDVTERLRAEDAATRLGRILENSWNEIYIFDAETLRFDTVSRGGQENLGYSAEELQAMTPLDFKPEFTPEEFERLLAPLRSGEQEVGIFETVHQRKDGSLYPVEVRLQRADTEHPPVFIAIIVDITERRQAQEQVEAQATELETLNDELRERTAELEQALAARNRFYAAMSHELRTPINAVIGYNDLILGGIYGELGEKQTAGIERSQRAARHLMEIVGDVLDISRLEAGKVEIRPEPVSLGALLEDLSVTTESLARRHGTTIRLGQETCAATLATDPRHVRQILLNLLSNAAKYGGEQPVEIHCRNAGAEVAIEVVDRGPGIAPEDRERIFEEFVQLEPGDTGQGTGLGLSISRRLAERLGGRLELESAPGRGSTFRLVLPAAPPAEGGEESGGGRHP